MDYKINKTIPAVVAKAEEKIPVNAKNFIIEIDNLGAHLRTVDFQNETVEYKELTV